MIPKTFYPGDRVMVLGKMAGTVLGRDDLDPILYRVEQDNGSTLVTSHHDMERINEVDEPAPEAAGSAETMPASVEGAATGDTGSAGAEAEPAETEQPWIAPIVPTELDRLEAKVEHAIEAAESDAYGVDPLSGEIVGEEDPTILELLKQNQTLRDAVKRLAAENQRRYIESRVGTPRTTRRVHTKIVKNTKGYQHEISVEVTSDDPTWSVTDDVRETLDLADKDARLHITSATYRDEHGLPGEEDTPGDEPF